MQNLQSMVPTAIRHRKTQYPRNRRFYVADGDLVGDEVKITVDVEAVRA